MSGGMRASMISLCSQGELDLKQVFTSVGTYKGSIVAIKRINKRYVDLTRSVRKELKLVRCILKVIRVVSRSYQEHPGVLKVNELHFIWLEGLHDFRKILI